MARYTIEVAQRQNESHIFAPLSQRVRGRWDFANVADKDLGSDGLKAMAREVRVIPGMYITCDTELMKGVILDPLAEVPEHKRTWEVMARIMAEHKSEFGMSMKPHPSAEFDLTHDNLKDWLWEFHKLLKANMAVLHSATPFPTADEIARMPGRRTRDPFNSGTQEKDLKKYVDVVPVKEKRETATAG